jgi:hypothetical protein
MFGCQIFVMNLIYIHHNFNQPNLSIDIDYFCCALIRIKAYLRGFEGVLSWYFNIDLECATFITSIRLFIKSHNLELFL